MALFAVTSLQAQDIQLSVQAPQQGVVGQMLRVNYVIKSNGTDMPQGQFRVDDFEGFIKRYGPAVSQSSQMMIINGRQSGSMSKTYTYTIEPTAAGTFHLPIATYTDGNKTYKSQSRTIHILDADNSTSGNNGSSNNGHSAQPSQSMPSAKSSNRSGDRSFFVVPTLSKQRVFEQEAVLLTYKIYFNADLSSVANDEPTFDGLHVQAIDPNGQHYQTIEDYHGQRYSTVVWRRYLLFPQRTGTITIPSVKYEALVREVVTSNDPIEQFFGGGSLIQSVRREVMAPSVTIHVDSLPSPRPAGFTGGVGSFSISSQVTPQSLKANEATTMRVTISGTGNLHLMRAPEVQWPRDFETYDPKSEEQTHLTTDGVTGSMVFDYIAVPRHEGQYEVAPLEFVYFDTKTRTYKTLRTNAASLDVARGEGHQQLAQEDIEELGSDIRHIKTSTANYIKDGNVFFGSTRYWLYYGAALLAFLIMVVGFRRYAATNADIVGKRGRKASSAATKRLRAARKLMQQQQSAQFYDETMRALYGYVSDKLNIPQSQLNKDNVSEQLAQRGVDDSVTQSLIQALDECEFARFAPGDPASTMDHVYNSAEAVINQMERSLRKIKGNAARAIATIILIGMATAMPATAQTREQADSAYTAEDYQLAAYIYKSLLAENGESSTIYYNLGNCYYRLDSIGRAILNYERALLLNPGDADTRFNLQMARSHTADKVMPAGEMFFVTWWHSLMLSLGVQTWGWLAITTFVLMLVAIGLFIFLPSVGGRKTAFGVAVAMLVVCIVANIAAAQARSHLLNRTSAIVMSPSAVIHSTPSKSGTDLFILHEGTHVELIDDSMSDWVLIQMADGKEGWISRDDIERI